MCPETEIEQALAGWERDYDRRVDRHVGQHGGLEEMALVPEALTAIGAL